VSMSISGQNERWAKLDAHQPSPNSQSGANGRWASAIGNSESGAPVENTGSAGTASDGMSDVMSVALMSFSGAWGTGSGGSQQGPGQTGIPPVMPSLDPPSSTQGASGIGPLPLTDMQSTMAALTGGVGQSPAMGPSSADGSVAQGLQTL
jgi:hypothetical protein